MKYIDGYLKGQEGFNLYFQGRLPEETPRAIIFFIHGLAEHSGRYAGAAATMLEQNYAVFCHDHQGHGFPKAGRAISSALLPMPQT